MADNKQIVVLNLGSQRLGGAIFGQAGGNLILKRYEFVEMTGDPTVDVSRLPQLKIGIEELADKLKIAKKDVWYAVAGHTVFTRFVKLPPVQGDKMEQIVEFEARQNVPFPIDEVIWDFEVVGEPLGETEVVLVAVKADSLNEINDQIAENGLTTVGVDLAPLALYNSFRYNYPDVGEPVVLIDLGARSTNVVFVEEDRFYTRNILVGGASVTAAIGKEFGWGFSDAEAQKVTHGFVALGGAVEAHPDPEVAALSKVMRNAMTRLHGEVMRTINYHRSQQGGAAPQRAFLCGGGATMGYALDFFQEKLKIPVEIFNGLRGVQLDRGVSADSAQAEAANFGELTGLALRHFGACPAEVELVPDALASSRDAARRAPAIIMAGLCLVATIGASIAYFKKADQVVQAKVATMESEQRSLRSVADELRSLDDKLDTLRGQSAQIESAVNTRSYWVRLLQELNNKFETDLIWLTLVEPVQNSKSLTPSLTTGTSSEAVAADAAGQQAASTEAAHELHIQGLYRKNDAGQEVVYQYVRALAASEWFEVADVEKRLNQIVKAETGVEEDRYAYKFDIRLPLKQHIEFKN
jgi:type IV pilus assembly protein PilM